MSDDEPAPDEGGSTVDEETVQGPPEESGETEPPEESGETEPPEETGVQEAAPGGSGPDEAGGAADAEETAATDTDTRAERPGNEWTPGWLADVRANDDRRHAALVAAALVGLGAAMVHWAGLFVAGALVGLASKSLRRAPVAGLAVGGLVLVVHVGASPVMGPAEFLGLAPAAYLSVGAGLLFPLWGSLVRGVL